MPFIDSRITVPVSREKKEEIKAKLGQAIGALHKTENYLMVGIESDYDLWMAGERGLCGGQPLRKRFTGGL